MNKYAEFAAKYVQQRQAQAVDFAPKAHAAQTRARELSDALHEGQQLVKDKKAVRELVEYKIPGFFPTPAELAQKVIDWADIRPGQDVCEPSAGCGHIAELVPKSTNLVCVEVNHTLANILINKGFNVVYTDFLTWQPDKSFDHVVMNPPFENSQDIDHVTKAFSLLKPNGNLVAIVSGTALIKSTKKAEAFQALFSRYGTMQESLNDAFARSLRPTAVKVDLIKLVKY